MRPESAVRIVVARGSPQHGGGSADGRRRRLGLAELHQGQPCMPRLFLSALARPSTRPQRVRCPPGSTLPAAHPELAGGLWEGESQATATIEPPTRSREAAYRAGKPRRTASARRATDNANPGHVRARLKETAGSRLSSSSLHPCEHPTEGPCPVSPCSQRLPHASRLLLLQLTGIRRTSAREIGRHD